MSVAVFVFVKYMSKKEYIHIDRLQKNISKLAQASFGIYLIHILIMNTIVDTFSVNVYEAWWRFLGAFIVYGLSLIVVSVIQRIPGGHYIMP